MNKKLFLIFILILSSCTTKQIPEDKVKYSNPEIDKLTKFFEICNADIQKAVKVIAENKMAGVLTFLKKMDMEGKKYYLLERENLTAMIKAVTEGTYSDLILINNSGVIIYTMINDEIFGKSVKTHLKDSALNICFNKSSEAGFYIDDVSMFPPNSGTPKIFVSLPDKRDNSIKGIFVIQIDIEILASLYTKIPVIIGKDGIYRLDKDVGNILKPYNFFEKINIDKLDTLKKQTIQIDNNYYNYYPFDYNSLSWIVISEN
jgi:hypothetical protein